MNKNVPFSIEISEFEKNSVTAELKQSYFALINSIWEEFYPTAPSISYESFQQHFFKPIPNKKSFSYLLFKIENGKKELVGSGDIIIESPESPFFEERKHIAQFMLNVKKGDRREGLGTKLFQTIVKKALEFKFIKSLELTGAVPLAESIAFSEKYRGEVIYEAMENRIYLEEINWSLIDAWWDEGQEVIKKKGILLETTDKIPEDKLERLAKLYTEILYQKSYDKVDTKDRITPVSLRNREKELVLDKIRWIHFIAENPTGEIIAILDLRYHLDALERITETVSIVNEEYKETQIAKKMKAQMLKFIKNNLPKVERILIQGEKSYMREINKKIGFKKHLQGKNYKFDLSELVALLNE
ncbi:MAG: GNAT family N-acetyltransferase [Candidatus Hodarchaeota archaeon]